MRDQGRLDEAVACCRRALELKPDFAVAHYNLGNALKDMGNLDEAAASYRRALQLNPDFYEAQTNLGATLHDEGDLDEALACYRRALELMPFFGEANSNRLYTLNFSADYDARAIYEEHRRWNETVAEPLPQSIQGHSNDPTPDRRLRIGYVSPDFRSHPVGRFLLPLLESHDHRSVEVFCYASLAVPDSITERCRAHADVWRNVLGLSDEQLANTIRQDQIDILVDLTMHMGGSRLLAFARKPAPVQVTYLAYCGTTGLRTIDYRLTDPYLTHRARPSACIPNSRFGCRKRIGAISRSPRRRR